MLRMFQEFLDSLNPGPTPAEQEQALQLATAVLLVEVMRSDSESPPAERNAVLAALHRRFTLMPEQLQALVARAEETSRSANDFFAFTSLINDRFTHPQKVRIVESMWQVAYADGHIDENENHVISKVAGLLYVTHGEYIAAKLRAREAAGLGPGT
jgi:uncharacterized tellurite resistance protein B-like protein